MSWRAVEATGIATDHGVRTQSEVPWLRSGKGRAHAASFFQALGGLELQRFEVKEVLEGPDVVVALVDLDFIIKASGRRVRETDEVHVWRFDRQGRCVRFRHAVDTAAHERAWRADEKA